LARDTTKRSLFQVVQPRAEVAQIAAGFAGGFFGAHVDAAAELHHVALNLV
jgi:hypothetical protein